VSFVEGVLLPRPEKGLTPTLSAKDALEAAMHLRPTYVKWMEPVRLGPVDTTAGSTGVDFEFGSSSATAQEVADAIAHEIVRQLVDDWDDPMSEDPIDEPFLVWTDKLGSGAFFDWPRTGWTCDVTLSFGIGSPTGGEYVHWSTPTIIAHEFGHLVAYRYEIIGFPNFNYGPAFGEGYADATAAVFIQDSAGALQPTVIGPDLVVGGCTHHLREPLAFDPCFPVCFGGSGGDWYKSGMLLAALWIETREAMGFVETRDLFAAWSHLAVPHGIEYNGCQPCSNTPPYQPNPCAPDESAGPGTLVQALTADDDDDDLSNGTPNDETLCAIYAARNIAPDIDIDICEASPGCEERGGSGAKVIGCVRPDEHPVYSILCFIAAVQSNSRAADLNLDGAIDLYDWLFLAEHLSQAGHRLGSEDDT
jgi:hypothetical protein